MERRKQRKERYLNTRITGEARALIEALAQAKGVSLTAVLELAVRDYAKREGISVMSAGGCS